MINTRNQYDYRYKDSAPIHHHAYLLPLLLEILAKRQATTTKSLRILDLGCGNGSLTNQLVLQGYEVTGIDSSKEGILIARQSFPNCEFIEGSVYNLPYRELEHAFDVVISLEVIEHLLYPRELLRAAKRCLKSEQGLLILTTPYHGYLKNLILALTGHMDQHFTALWDGGHIKFFSVATLTKLLQEEGLADIRFQFAGRLPLLWKTMLCCSSPIA